MTPRALLAGAAPVALVVLALSIVPGFAQNRFSQDFHRFPEFFAEAFPPLPPLPPMPPMPPLPPLPAFPFEYQDFDFNFNFDRITRGNVDPEVALRQEVFRSLLRTSPDRALDIAAERLKADPADPVVLANLSAIAQTNSPKSMPLLLSIAKSSTNVDARRNAISAVSRSRNGKESLTLLEDLYNGAKDNTDVRRAIVQSIARISDPGAVPVLARIARSDSDITIRRTAARSLGTRDEPEANKLLEELLRPTK